MRFSRNLHKLFSQHGLGQRNRWPAPQYAGGDPCSEFWPPKMLLSSGSAHNQPKNIEARAEIGHWEGDLIIYKRTRPMLVFHERKSRVTLAARLIGKTAADTISVMLAVLGRTNPGQIEIVALIGTTALTTIGCVGNSTITAPTP
jgi:hypothetical protein